MLASGNVTEGVTVTLGTSSGPKDSSPGTSTFDDDGNDDASGDFSDESDGLTDVEKSGVSDTEASKGGVLSSVDATVEDGLGF